MINQLLFSLNFSKSKEKADQPESPKKVEPTVEAEKSKEAKHEEEEEEEEVAEEAGSSGGGWGSWTSGWIDTGSASALLGKALSSVNAAVEVAKTKVNIVRRLLGSKVKTGSE